MIMARNLKRYGYAPNRRHNLVVEEIRFRRRQGLTSKPRRPRTPAEQRAAIESMTEEDRLAAYAVQRGTPGRGLMTPRQRRRFIRKATQAELR